MPETKRSSKAVVNQGLSAEPQEARTLAAASEPAGSAVSIPAYVPQELQIRGKPSLRKFPRNILFAKFGTGSGEAVLGGALYEPDLSSLTRSKKLTTLFYNNKYGGNSSVRITFDRDKQAWEGLKTVNGKTVGVAHGTQWENFFVHLTMLGLTNGEACEFLAVPVSPSEIPLSKSGSETPSPRQPR